MFLNFSPNRYEHLIRSSSLPKKQRLLLSGTAKALRLAHGHLEERERAVRIIAADVLSPLLFLFTGWVLQKSIESGLKRLYFLARDGQIMHRVAEVLVKQWNLEIELRYLYCSRESLCHVFSGGLTTFDLEWLTKGHFGEISLAEICFRLRCSRGDFKEILARHDIDQFEEFDANLNQHRLDQVKEIIGLPEVAEYLAEQGKMQSLLAERYLLQEGLMDYTQIGVVDTGWKGTSQFALYRLLASNNTLGNSLLPAIHGFYLGVKKDAYLGPGHVLHGFLFDEPKCYRPLRLSNFPCLEMLCSSQHGRVHGYVARDGQLEPLMDQPLCTPYLEMIEIHHKIAVSYAQQLASLIDIDAFTKLSGSNLCCRLLEKYIGMPELDIARTYGDWPMGFEIREADRREMAPSVGTLELMYYLGGRKKYGGFWPQASFIRAGLGVLARLYNVAQRIGALTAYRRIVMTHR